MLRESFRSWEKKKKIFSFRLFCFRSQDKSVSWHIHEYQVRIWVKSCKGTELMCSRKEVKWSLPTDGFLQIFWGTDCLKKSFCVFLMETQLKNQNCGCIVFTFSINMSNILMIIPNTWWIQKTISVTHWIYILYGLNLSLGACSILHSPAGNTTENCNRPHHAWITIGAAGPFSGSDRALLRSDLEFWLCENRINVSPVSSFSGDKLPPLILSMNLTGGHVLPIAPLKDWSIMKMLI